jgi:DNA-binding response OmpR family regulator
MEQRAGRVLVLDDAVKRRQRVCKSLDDAGYRVLPGLPDEGLDTVIDIFEPDVILARLDSTPKKAVSSLLQGLDVPVVGFASADTPADARVAAVRARVDSIFTEPLERDELLARVAVLMEDRRCHRVLTVDDLTIDRDGHVIRRNGVELQLTPTEYSLLLALASNVGQVLSKRQLLERVWGFDEYDVNVVEVHVSSLRRKLEALGPRLIQTVRGFGYVMRQAGTDRSGRARPPVGAIVQRFDP